ncbi:tail fiber assembly protein [Serratia quinivorans]
MSAEHPQIQSQRFFAAKDKNPHVEWNKYRMALNQMDVTTSSDVGWPVSL